MTGVTIIDFGVGNLRSIQKMFERVGSRAVITSAADAVATAERLVLPGVGHFAATIDAFRQSGLEQPLRHAVLSGAALLGVCVGAQMLLSHGDEGDVAGLDLVPGRVVRFSFENDSSESPSALKIPHMGWRSLNLRRRSVLFADDAQPRFYFTHSYHPLLAETSDVLATACYGYEFAAIFARDRIWGAQFHPEKSHMFGMDMLRRFSKV